MSAHSTIIQFLHKNPYDKFISYRGYRGLWWAEIWRNDSLYYCGTGPSYEAACADLVSLFPKP